MIKSIVILGFMLMGIQAETPMKDEDAFIKKFEKISETTSSIRCDFVQKKHLSFSKEPLVSKGKMVYQDGNMRWDQNLPKPYLMVINDNELKIKEDGEVTTHGLEENKYMKGLKEIMIGSMTGTLLNSPHFEYELFENDQWWIVKLNPKKNRMKKMFSQVVMNFDRLSYRMQNVVLKEENGDYTQIDFVDAVFNEKIEASAFEL